jgi:hypothetical protein
MCERTSAERFICQLNVIFNQMSLIGMENKEMALCHAIMGIQLLNNKLNRLTGSYLTQSL